MWLNEKSKIVGLDWNPVAQILFDQRYGANIDVIFGDVVVTLDSE